MTHNQLNKFLTELGLTKDPATLTWQMDIRYRRRISEESILYSDEKHVMRLHLEQARRSLEDFIADLEKKVVEYEQERL